MSLVQHEIEMESWRQYMATVCWSIGKMQAKNYPISPYEKPNFKVKETDERNAGEIIGDILKKVGGGKT